MTQISSTEYLHRLRSLMQSAEISSFKALSRQAGVSQWQVNLLRQGHAEKMRAEALYQLSQTLHISMTELLNHFSHLPLPSNPASSDNPPEPDASDPSSHRQAIAPAPLHLLQDEYQRLQNQLAQHRETLWQEFQQTSLQVLESWLIQFPTAAHAAQNNPQIPASRLLPLMRPVEQLLKDWHIEAIAPVGAELPYDPQHHQLMDGVAHPGDAVKVRYTGYKQGDKLLYRAKVSPVPTP